MIYCISGLGADKRVFQYLRLDGLPLQHIHWVRPNRDESITRYTERLLEQIDLTDEVVVIGVSFGGLIAQEMAQLIPCQKVILISSIKSERELPWALRIVRLLRLHKMVPPGLLKWSSCLTADYFFSTESPHESTLLQAIIRDTDPVFLRWAIGELVRWRNDVPVAKQVHLHGTRDRLFSIRLIRNAIRIEGGGHFMIVNRAETISNFIREVLQCNS